MSVGIQRQVLGQVNRAVKFPSDAALVCAEIGWSPDSAGSSRQRQDWMGSCLAAGDTVLTSSAFDRFVVGRLEEAAR